MSLKIGGTIEKVNGKELFYSEFAEKYLAGNQPVLLTGLMDDWTASKHWVSSNGQPNLLFFLTHFGKSKVQVADCDTREFTDQKRIEMSVSEFVNHWLQGSKENHDVNGKSVLYLKDWHFVKLSCLSFSYPFQSFCQEYPEYQAYITPLFFTDDWLNLYLDNYHMHDDLDADRVSNDISCSDYRFVYMGAKGSSTDATISSLAFKVQTITAISLAFIVIVAGVQENGNTQLTSCLHLSCFTPMLKAVKSFKCTFNFFPAHLKHMLLFSYHVKAIWLECIQEQNEIIFVPSGWYHQVHNLWNLLLRDYKEAKEYIEDIKDICDDFEGLCQRNLAANTGMNFNDFFIFISRFSLANVVELYYLRGELNSESSIWHCSAIIKHFALNLSSIRKTALKMKSEGVEGNLSIINLLETLSDPRFLKLCTGLGRIYSVIHEEENWSCTMKKALMADFAKYGSQVCSPEDLITFIDYAVSKLSSNCDEQNSLLSVLYEIQPHEQN
ncbi:jmjC domain-containing protein 4 [Gossypium australe]|uniref:JmjC domain-containing protein 4 n=1 Tax=Gossypium australe TaxID=47621 RepID=A0A5B6URU9_9ROSI|nr:jmjC domain-containing protein 4 [Gossypium australe]